MASTVTNAACTNWVSRSDDWRSDSKGTDRIMQGWQGTSYGQTKTAMTVVVFTVPTGEIVKSGSLTFSYGDSGYHQDKTLKIVRPVSSAPKTFTSSTTSESVRPTSEVLLQSATIGYQQTVTITFNADVLAYLAEGYNYIVICNFETGTSSYTSNYMNNTGATYSYTTDSPGVVKIWNGSTWVNATPYIYNGSTWVKAVPYVWNGSAWKVGTS